MNLNQLRAVARLLDVKRWNMVRTTREQSVLEHSAMVGTISARIVTRLRQADPNCLWTPQEAMYVNFDNPARFGGAKITLVGVGERNDHVVSVEDYLESFTTVG